MELGTIVGFVFTLLIFSYVLADNFLYRFAIYVFVGLTASLTTIVTFESVIIPLTRSTPELILGLVALAMALLLLLKPLRRLTFLTNLPLAFLIGVGTAITLIGAITGTLLPFTFSTSRALQDGNIIEGIIIVVGVICSLMYFQYSARRLPDGSVKRGPLVSLLSTVGQGFIVVTLGAVYGAAIITSLTILAERISFLTSIGG